MQGSKFLRAPPLALGHLAMLTPPEFEVQIIDNDFEEIPYHSDWDLVGITATTPVVKRAYAVAQRFKKLKVPTIIGGFHSSFLPKESAKYFDSVVIGEAENLWQPILQDFQKGQLKKFYKDKNGSPAPPIVLKKNLFNPKNYYSAIQITKGCTFQCSFCSIRKVYKQYRVMPIRHVLQNLYNIRGKNLYIVDDNLFCKDSYCIKLFKSMIESKLNKNWWVQAPTTIVENKKLLNLAVESGLIACQMGLESISQEALNNSRKFQNRVDSFRKIIKILHDYGVMVVPFFLYGFDTDTKEIFTQTVDFACDIGCDAVAFWILTPFPGTDLFDQYKNQERLLSTNWDLYDGYHCVFKPRNLSPKELENGLFTSFEDFYGRSFKLSSIMNRFKGKQMQRMLFKAPGLFYHIMKLIMSINTSINRLKCSLLEHRSLIHNKKL